MDWITPLSALVGAAIGAGATLAGEALRARQRRASDDLVRRRELYVEYLSVLARTNFALRLAAYVPDAGLPLEARLRIAFQDTQAHAWRERINLLAPAGVRDASERAFTALREVRDALMAGVAPTDPQFGGVRERFADRAADLRAAMRADLGT